MFPDTLKQVADSVIVQQGATQSVSYVVLAVSIIIALWLFDKTVLSSAH
jgi:hypothetical protein